MKAYSRDLRQRMVGAVVDQGLHPRLVAERFAVGLTTVKRYVHLAEAAALTPKPIPGRPRTIGPEQQDALRAQLAAHTDVTLSEHCRLWHETQGVAVSRATMSRAIQRLGWTRKKDAGSQCAQRDRAPAVAGSHRRPRPRPLRLPR
jgi:transposase